MPIYYLLGIVLIGVGLRIVSKGYAAKSKPRMVLGLAVVPVGVSQFLRQIPWLAATLLALALVLFVVSLFMLKAQNGRIVRTNSRRRR